MLTHNTLTTTTLQQASDTFLRSMVSSFVLMQGLSGPETLFMFT